HGAEVDVGRQDHLEALVDDVETRYGPVDLFCSNAGVAGAGGPEAADAVWQNSWDVNVMAHVRAARVLLPRMLERGGGYLLQTASAAGLLSQFDAPYAVTKHAAVAFSEWLTITYGSRGIGVSCLCPGAVETPMFQAQSEARQALMAGGAGRMTPEEVAASVVDGLREERFLIVPHLKILDYVRGKADDLEGWLAGMRHLHDKARNDQ
ncbi:SDR family NAD(P)-dependent oxidoreductase, partial [Ectothiorhodospiraceae bacterium WFHF3C12]|nr:SDR family NAD(P)-dependent oxidoreductase [Ectothiorhodospiraceae bacterium WFHF3C12]